MQSIPEAVAMCMVVMAGGRLRGRGFDSRFGTFFFFTPFFFLFLCNCFIFSPFFFLHGCSAISMLKHFSSYSAVCKDNIIPDLCKLHTEPL